MGLQGFGISLPSRQAPSDLVKPNFSLSFLYFFPFVFLLFVSSFSFLGSGASQVVLAFMEQRAWKTDQELFWDPSEQAGVRDAKKESQSLSDDGKTMVK